MIIAVYPPSTGIGPTALGAIRRASDIGVKYTPSAGSVVAPASSGAGIDIGPAQELAPAATTVATFPWWQLALGVGIAGFGYWYLKRPPA